MKHRLLPLPLGLLAIVAVLAVGRRLECKALRAVHVYTERRCPRSACKGTIGAMPKCDFSCAGCYLNADANRARPKPLSEIKQQLQQIRAWLGPAGNVQITDGEVTLRDESEVSEIISHARNLGLVPMLMSHGETFRRRPGLLERLMERGGLSELSIHIDTTQRGRRERYAQARTEAELDGLPAEF